MWIPRSFVLDTRLVILTSAGIQNGCDSFVRFFVPINRREVFFI